MATAAAAETAPEPPPAIGGAGVLAAGAMGAAVAIALGLYGRVHEPASDLAITLGFADTITMKVWLSSFAVLFALFQVFTALWMYGRLPFSSRPSWLANAHRISGRLAFLISLPVAYHCLYQLAFQDTTTRVLAHSLLGCLFYGAFATKVTIIHMPRRAGVWLPVVGGTVFALLVATWVTSGLWFITTSGIPAP
jgi:Family of unknown function (DUF6529)